MSYGYKNIISAFIPQKRFHDDFCDEGVEILDFPFATLFGDFRLFNGLRLDEVDTYIGRIREIMIDIKNRQQEIKREEELRETKRHG